MSTDNTALLAVVLPQIQREESCRLVAYRDSKGIPTIGWGRADAGVTMGMTCSQADADAWLLNHVTNCTLALDHSIDWWRDLSIPRQAVLLEMAYQMGTMGLLAFHNTLAAVERGDWASAKIGMLGSHWAIFDSPARAKREATQMFTGQVAP